MPFKSIALCFRWDVNCIENLPNYMKGLYKAILEFYGHIQQQICNDNDVPFARLRVEFCSNFEPIL